MTVACALLGVAAFRLPPADGSAAAVGAGAVVVASRKPDTFAAAAALLFYNKSQISTKTEGLKKKLTYCM